MKLFLLLVLLQIATFTALAQTADAPGTSRPLLHTGHLRDVKTGAEPWPGRTVPAPSNLASGPISSPSTATHVKDVKILQHASFVMKSGVFYKDETHKQ